MHRPNGVLFVMLILLSAMTAACTLSTAENQNPHTDNELLQTEDSEHPTLTMALSARIPKDSEQRRRCRLWAPNNLKPIVY